MQAEYKGYYLEEGENGVVYVYDSVEAWREKRWVYIGDNEYLAKMWIDLLVGNARAWAAEPLGENGGPLATSIMGEYPGWDELVSWTNNWGLSLAEAVQEDLADAQVTQAAVHDYKMVMGGYFIIASGKASDSLVDSVYDVIKTHIAYDMSITYDLYPHGRFTIHEAIKRLRREQGISEDAPILRMPTDVGYLPALERVLWLNKFFVNGTRVDKVIAIDTAMHMVHDEGSYIMVVLGQYIRGGAIENITPHVLEELFLR